MTLQDPRSGPDPAPATGIRVGHVLIFLAAWGLTQVAVAGAQFPEVMAGAQVDSDGYFRLIRVGVLLDGGGWYNASIPISNWPYGQDLHWTRPLDVLIILLAAPLAVVVPAEKALLIAGGVVSPLLHAGLCLVGIWVISPLVSGPARFLAAAALLAQPGVMAYATAGRADHHVMVLLLSVLALGAWIRALMEPERRGWATWAGFAAAAAIWVSPEALVPLAALFAGGGAAWVLLGPKYATPNLRLCVGLVAGVALAILVERPPGEWWLAEYDRVSVAHAFMGLLAGGFWLVAAVISMHPGDWRQRGVVAAFGGVVSVGVLYLAHPGFFLGPGAAMDPWLREFAFDTIAELQPVFGLGWGDLGRTVALLGLAPAALWFVARAAWHGADERSRVGWYPLLAGVLLFVPLAAAQARLVGYAGAALALAATGLLAVLLRRADRTHAPGVRLRAVRLGTMVTVLVGPLVLGAAIGSLGTEDDASGEDRAEGECGLPAAIRVLEASRPATSHVQVVAVSPNLGPALAFRTGDRIIAGPYHRSPEAIGDLFRFFRTSDMAEAEDLARSRQVSVVLICPTADGGLMGGDSPDTLYGRLAEGGERVPAWLRPIPVDDETADGFLGYSVDPPGGYGDDDSE